MATVPGNILQQHFKDQMKSLKRPSFGMKSVRQATLIRVYDRDTLTEIPGELARLIARRPGHLYGQVQLSGKEIYYLPFVHGPEYVYSIYGDSQSLAGRTVNIVYYDRNIQRGEIEILSPSNVSLRDTNSSSNVFDIGGIF